jgi:hypothetical protein
VQYRFQAARRHRTRETGPTQQRLPT